MYWEFLDRPVIDNSGFTGLFDFHLEFSRDFGGGGGGGSGRKGGGRGSDPSVVAAALQEQLGLKLTPEKGPSNSW